MINVLGPALVLMPAASSWVTLVLATLLFTLVLLFITPSTGLSNVNRRVHMSEHTSPPMLTPDALVTHTLPIPPVYGPGT